MLSKLLDSKTLRSLESFQLQSRKKFLGVRQGGHISLRRGHGIEFSDYRNYEPGDDPRHIDWGLYGRSDKLYVRRFQEEQDLNVYFVLDNSRSLFVPRVEAKWLRLLQAALAVAYVALMQGDTVYFLLVGEKQPMACRSLGELNRIASLLANHQGCGDARWDSEILKTIQGLKFPGVAFLFSDLLFEYELFERLAFVLLAKNLEINIVRIAAESDYDPSRNELEYFLAIDAENKTSCEINFDANAAKEYLQLLNKHYQQIQEFCFSRAIASAVYQHDSSLLDFVLSDLKPLGMLQC